MLDDINSTQKELWESLKSKPYREAFATSHLSTNITSQIFSMREDRGWTQQQLAEETGMAQPRISVLEDGSYDRYDRYNLKTLRRIASAFDVALVVRFVPFSELVEWTTTISPEKLAPPKFGDDSLPGSGSPDFLQKRRFDLARLVISGEAPAFRSAAAIAAAVATEKAYIQPSAAVIPLPRQIPTQAEMEEEGTGLSLPKIAA